MRFDSAGTGLYDGAAMDAKSLGPVIRKWRIESGLTQQALGRRADLPGRIVGSIERGERAPEKWEIVRLCQALEKPPAELITFWCRAYLHDLQELGRLQAPRPVQPEEKRVEQIIDRIAGLAKEIYRESKDDFREIFLSWIEQPDRGSTKA